MRGASYIDLPKVIKNKKVVINVQNYDQKCFLWSILSALHPVPRDPQRVTKYTPYEHELDEALKGKIVKMDDILKFDKQGNIYVNVYSYNKDHVIYPLSITKNIVDKHVSLLYMKDENNSHYCWIKSLSRLLSSQISKKEHVRYICERCLSTYSLEDKLKDHETYYKIHDAVKIEMPTKMDKILEFKNYNNSLRVPFVIYADFECLLRKTDTCKPDPSKSYTTAYQKHEPISFSYYVKYANGSYKPPVTYVGLDAPKVFMEMLTEETIAIKRYTIIKYLGFH